MVSLVAAGCGDAAQVAPPPAGPLEIVVVESPSPFHEVSAGSVTAFLPDDWKAHAAGALDDPRQGLLAGPRPNAWTGDRPPAEGYAAVWIDGTQVGVPSDYYYLAATRTALGMLTRSSDCRATDSQVFVDHRPAFAAGEPESPGDYIARGQGTCATRHQSSQWAYFIAAPGYGPARELGIPSSSLYLVVAMMPDSPRADRVLERLLERTEFGGASIDELIDAASPVTLPVPGLI